MALNSTSESVTWRMEKYSGEEINIVDISGHTLNIIQSLNVSVSYVSGGSGTCIKSL